MMRARIRIRGNPFTASNRGRNASKDGLVGLYARWLFTRNLPFPDRKSACNLVENESKDAFFTLYDG